MLKLYLEARGGGILIQNYKFKTRLNGRQFGQVEKSRGFTLVEMLVVMGIIAFLMLLSTVSLISLRGQFVVDADAEEVVSTIREAQNKSISVMGDRFGNATKVWEVSLEEGLNSFELISLYTDPVNSQYLTGITEKETPLSPGTTITVTRDGTNVSAAHISFSSPFGKTYLNNELYIGGAGACHWTNVPEKPAQDYFISPAACPGSSSISQNEDSAFRIILNHGGKTASVLVNSNGDAYIE